MRGESHLRTSLRTLVLLATCNFRERFVVIQIVVSVLRDLRDRQSEALQQVIDSLDKLPDIPGETQARPIGPTSLLDPWKGTHLEKSDVQRLLMRAGLQVPVAETSLAGMLATRCAPSNH